MVKKLDPVAPGEVLAELYMEPNGLSANALAIALRIPASRLHEILHGRRAITADTALRLARFFGTTPLYWLNLQADYELQKASDRSEAINREVSALVIPRESRIKPR
jgi:addiction module HigA family antidote